MTNKVSLLCVALLLAACWEVPNEELPVAHNRQPLVTGQNNLQYWAYKENNMYAALTADETVTFDANGIATLPLNSFGYDGSTYDFNFYFYGKSVHTAYISVNGLITFDNAPTSSLANNESVHTTNIGPAIAGWWDDVTVYSGGLSYEFCSLCNPRTLTFQWKYLHRTGTSGPYRQMQVKLYEHSGSPDSNTIKVNYGGTQPTTSCESATIGLIAGTGARASTETNCVTTTPTTPDMGCDPMDLALAPSGTNCGEADNWVVGTDHTRVYKPAPQSFVSDRFTSSYADITGTDITPSDTDDGYTMITLPFDFTYYGFVYQKAYVSVNGFIVFDAPPTGWNWINEAVDASGLPNNAILPWWDDLVLPDAMDPNPGSIQVESRSLTMGGPINELVIQWKNFKHYGPDTTLHNMQVHLFANNSTGTMRDYIEVVYGPVVGAAAADDATIGLRDETVIGGPYKLSPDCSPSCGASDWPTSMTGGNSYRFRRPAFTDLYNNYFSKTGGHTLHCFACHYEFRQDPTPLHTPVLPASLAATYALMYTPFHAVAENLQYIPDPVDGGYKVDLFPVANSPACGADLGSIPSFAQTGTVSLFDRLPSDAFDPMSNALRPGDQSQLGWVNPTPFGKMPYDCSCSSEGYRTGMACVGDYTFEKGRRDILTWWSEGAQQN